MIHYYEIRVFFIALDRLIQYPWFTIQMLNYAINSVLYLMKETMHSEYAISDKLALREDYENRLCTVWV